MHGGRLSASGCMDGAQRGWLEGCMRGVGRNGMMKVKLREEREGVYLVSTYAVGVWIVSTCSALLLLVGDGRG